MDHQHGVRRHHQAVGATGRHTAGTCRQGVDPGGATLTQTVQGVVDGQPLEEVATDGVEGHGDRRLAVIHGSQVLNELVGSDAPGSDLAIDVDLEPLVFLSLSSSLDAVPVLVLRRRRARRLVEDEQAERVGQRLEHGVLDHGMGSSSSVAVSAAPVV
ncbi:hypothetical protein D3C80_1557030 [compost metagenome]